MHAFLAPDLILIWFPSASASSRARDVIFSAGDSPLPAPIVMFGAPGAEDPSLGIAVLTRKPPSWPVSMALVTSSPHVTEADDAHDLADLLDHLTESAAVALLRHLLETAPGQFRAHGLELAASCGILLGRVEPHLPTINRAIRLPSGKVLVSLSSPNMSDSARVYRLDDSGIRREPAAFARQDSEHHWILDSITPSATGGQARIVAVDGQSFWQIPLIQLRPGPIELLFAYLESLDADNRGALIQDLDRWRHNGTAITPEDSAVIEDCRILLSGNVVDASGTSVKTLDHGIDHLVPLPGGGVFIQGWIFDPHERVESVELTDASGVSRPLPRPWPIPHEAAARCWRDAGFPAPEFAGFVGYLDSGADGPWRASLRLKSKVQIQARAKSNGHDLRQNRDRMLKSIAPSALVEGAIREALGPAVERIQRAEMARYPTASRIRSTVRIGARAEAPSVSIIVPVYRNLNFLGFQLAALSRDFDPASVEIIYLLDSPEQAGFAEGRLRGEHLVYGIPVTLAIHTANLGFAAAVNSGARIARGDVLVFLNSDVVPKTTDWLERMLADLDRPDIGAVGPKLLYLDESLQFAGMYYARDPEGIWYNRHFMKGYPGSHAPANEAREVPAVTGACLMISRQSFQRLDGFDENFVIGDFEDSYLCIRLAQKGLKCWYQPAAVLYHVERQSVDRHDAHNESAATMVNRWRQHRLWAPEIEAIMTDAEQRWNLPPAADIRIERLE